MKNNKGFTLTELIVVVAILALLTLIITPNIITLIKDNKMRQYNQTIDNIINATKLYVSDNRQDIDHVCIGSNTTVTTNIELSTLQAGYITSIPENTCTKIPDFTQTDIVSVEYNCINHTYKYEVLNRNKLENSNDCN